MMENNIVTFEKFGAKHQFNLLTKEYSMQRGAGFFSNFNVLVYMLVWLHVQRCLPSSVKLYLSEYFNDGFDVFNELFKTNDYNIKFESYKASNFEKFISRCAPCDTGLFTDKMDLDFRITDYLLCRYFTIKKPVWKISSINLPTDFDNAVFIWARKTDKVNETSIPNASAYKKVLEQNNLIGKTIYLQTDDKTVLQDFESQGIKFKTFGLLPLSESGEGFHVNLDKVTESDFLGAYGMTKASYLRQLVALAFIAAAFKYVMVYPGNLSTSIPIIRGTFSGCFLFKNANELF